MKKTIGKPENWQDFESLCKKLWGEIWGIPHKIKKNGRLGQKQAGVDVYGIPQNEVSYWGIQAKGKDDYSNACLTEEEIDNEIKKAKTFKPELSVYIIATTSNKDSKIEEYIRVKDIENRNQNSFEILLYCWEDIVDFIEENRDTYNWYVNNLMHKTKFDFSVLFNDFQESLVIKPILEKKTITHYFKSKSYEEILIKTQTFIDNINKPLLKFQAFNLHELNKNIINKSWVDFDIVLQNSGSNVLEDWSFTFRFISGVNSIDNESSGHMFGNFSLININKNDPRYIDSDNLSVKYKPIGNSVLVQKDNRSFKVSILVEKETSEIEYEWELIARDFDTKGNGTITVNPIYNEKFESIETMFEDEVKQEVIIDYLREEK